MEEASAAIQAGYASQMMLEVAPERSFGVLSPAFKGCEENFGLNECSANGCTFLLNERCALFGTGHQPLECRFCRHDRPGMGPTCHADLERDWNTAAGRALVREWCKITGLTSRPGIPLFDWMIS